MNIETIKAVVQLKQLEFDAQSHHLRTQCLTGLRWFETGLAQGDRWAADRFPTRLQASDAPPLVGIAAMGIGHAALNNPAAIPAAIPIIDALLNAELFWVPGEALAAVGSVPEIGDNHPRPSRTRPRLILSDGLLDILPEHWQSATQRPKVAAAVIQPDRSYLWIAFDDDPDHGAIALVAMSGPKSWPFGEQLVRLLDSGQWRTEKTLRRKLQKKQRNQADQVKEIPPVRIVQLADMSPRRDLPESKERGVQPVGHERRAHWHRYRVGTKIGVDSNEGITWTYRLRWVPAHQVLGGADDDRPTVYELPRIQHPQAVNMTVVRKENQQ